MIAPISKILSVAFKDKESPIFKSKKKSKKKEDEFRSVLKKALGQG